MIFISKRELKKGKNDFMGQMMEWINVKTILLWSGESGRKKD